ncbi:MAG: ABC transporter substrate-binding protein [Ignavibacteriaceae bacterium]
MTKSIIVKLLIMKHPSNYQLGEFLKNTVKLFLLITLFIIFILSSGCKNKNEQNKNQVVITFWHSFVSSSVPALKDLIAQFEKEHPGIIINAQYVPTGDALIQKLITAIQSKTAPDISWIHSDFIENLVEANAIYKLSDFIDGPDSISKSDINDIYPALLQYAKWKGTLYSLPMEATDLALLYNKGMFRKAGLDPNRPPQNWDELYADAKKLTIDSNHDGKFEQVGLFLPVYPAAGPLGGWMVWQWLPFLWQAGGNVINVDQSQVLYNSNSGVEALRLWQKIFNELNLNTFTSDFDVAFASQHLAMAMDGPWDLPRFADLLKNLDWAFAPLPAGPVKKATIVGGEYLTIFKQSKHPKEAWEFIKWMIKPETQAMWAMKSGYLPIRRDVLKIPAFQEYLKKNPNYKVFVDELDYGQAQRSIDYGGLQITRNLAESLEEATTGKIDPKKALDESAAKSNKILQSFKQ